MRALAALLGAAALALASLVVAPLSGPAAAASGYCSNGVLVLVDYGSLGGVQRGCASSPGTGLEALHQAGFETAGTHSDGEGFVCRINNKPNKDQEPCVRTPPASRYWSYWHAEDGQKRWSYSNRGAMSYHPEAGTIDAWAFGSTDVGGTSGGPSVCPDYARTQKQSSCATSGGSGSGGGSHHKPKPGRTTAKSDRHGGSNGGSNNGSDSSPAHRSASASGSSSASPSNTKSSSGASSSRPSSSGAATPGASESSGSLPPIVDASAVAGKDKTAGSGSALPVILGVALVALLGGGAGWTVLRRRRADAADL